MGIKGFSGRQLTESNLDYPISTRRGLQYGAQGLGREVLEGVTGIVAVPKKRVDESGMGCAQVTKGTFQGLFGLVMFPVTGTLKALHSMTTGVMNATGDDVPLRRFRYPRFFDEREIMYAYDPSYSHAYSVLHSLKDGKYKNEVIITAFDVSKFADKKRKFYKDFIFVCTDKRLIYVKDLRNQKWNFRLDDIKTIEVGPRIPVDRIIEDTFNWITILLHNEKQYSVNTGKSNKNAIFTNTIKNVIQKKTVKDLKAV